MFVGTALRKCGKNIQTIYSRIGVGEKTATVVNNSVEKRAMV